MNLIKIYLSLKDGLLPKKSQPLSGTIIIALQLKKSFIKMYYHLKCQ